MNSRLKKRFREMRALASDCNPIESPVIFSPVFFAYKYCKSDWSQDPLFSEILHYKRYTIPYAFSSSIAGGKRRDLNLVHPAGQIQMAKFLFDYSGAIIDRCSKSAFSLRKPVKVNKVSGFVRAINVRRNPRRIIPTMPAPTFFRYEKFNRLYRFHASDEYLSLERKFPLMMVLDVQKCFYSIYTHTIAWAIKDKKAAKSISQNGYLFENKLDRIFQRANFNETSGIVVGPEISRVFSEVILQDIDKTVEDGALALGLKIDRDFLVGRYIDNYYIFANKQEQLVSLKSMFEAALKRYKLYFNERKTAILSRPFVTTESQFTYDLQQLLSEFLEDLTVVACSENPLSPVLLIRVARERRFTAKRFIDQYRLLLARYSLDVGFQVTHVFGALRNFLLRLQDKRVCNVTKEDESHACVRLARDICLVVHHLFAVNPNVAVLESAVDIFLKIERLAEPSESVVLDEVRSSLAAMFREAFCGHGLFLEALNCSIEFAYFLPILKHFDLCELVSEQELLDVWDFASRNLEHGNAFPYWESVSFLHFVGGRGYSGLKKQIVDDLHAQVTRKTFLEQSDVCLALLDLLRCPYLAESDREALYMTALGAIGGTVQEKYLRRALADSDPWFVDWSERFDLARVIGSRRLQSPYS